MRHQARKKSRSVKSDAIFEEITDMTAKPYEVPPTTPDVTAPAPAPTPAAKASVVDAVFDFVTTWAASRLHATSRGLATSARWLEARARTVDDLATRLEPKATHASEGEPQAA